MNLPRTHATAISLAQNNSIFLLATEDSNSIFVYSINKDTSSTPPKITCTLSHSFATAHKNSITSLLLTADNSNVITLAKGLDTHLYVYSIKGELIKTLNTAQLANYQAAISKDGKLFAVGTKVKSQPLSTHCHVRSRSFKGSRTTRSASNGSRLLVSCKIPLDHTVPTVIPL